MSVLVPIKLCTTLHACQALLSGIAAALAVFSKPKPSAEKQHVAVAAAEAAATAAAGFFVGAAEGQAGGGVSATAAVRAAAAAGLAPSDVLKLASVNAATAAGGGLDLSDDALIQAEVATAVASVLQVRLKQLPSAPGHVDESRRAAVRAAQGAPPGDSLPVVMATCLMENHVKGGAPIIAAGGLDGERLKALMAQLDKHAPGTEEHEYYRGYMDEVIQASLRQVCTRTPISPHPAHAHVLGDLTGCFSSFVSTRLRAASDHPDSPRRERRRERRRASGRGSGRGSGGAPAQW